MLPFIYWMPKMHKKPFSKQRYIAASYKCSTKNLSALLTKCFRLIEKRLRMHCNYHLKEHGINPMWIINNSSEVHSILAPLNRNSDTKNLRTYDFSTLYTNIPHKLLKKEMQWVIHEAFRLSKSKYISIYAYNAGWSNMLHLATNVSSKLLGFQWELTVPHTSQIFSCFPMDLETNQGQEVSLDKEIPELWKIY